MRKKMLLLIIFFMAIGFATISATLFINGGIRIGYDKDALKRDLIFTNFKSKNETKGVSGAIVDDGKSITFTTNNLSLKGDNASFDFAITNYNLYYDAEAYIECTSSDEAYNEYLTVSTNNDNYFIAAGTTEDDIFNVELKKETLDLDSAKEINITCSINASVVERSSKATLAVASVDTYELTGTILKNEDEPVDSGLVVMYSEKKIYNLDNDGNFNITSIEDGIHHLYYLKDTTYEQVLKMDEEQISASATSTVELNVKTIGNEKVIEMSNNYLIDLEFKKTVPGKVDYAKYFNITSEGVISLKSNGEIDEDAYNEAIELWEKENLVNVNDNLIGLKAELIMAANYYNEELTAYNNFYDKYVDYYNQCYYNASDNCEQLSEGILQDPIYLKIVTTGFDVIYETYGEERLYELLNSVYAEYKSEYDKLGEPYPLDYCDNFDCYGNDEYWDALEEYYKDKGYPERDTFADPLYQEIYSLSSIIIPEKIDGIEVKKISNGCFEDLKNLSYVSMSDTITEIGQYAFDGTGLRTVKLSNNLERINKYAFSNSKLISIQLPDSLKSIGSYFVSGTDIDNIYISKSVETLDSGVFGGLHLKKLETSVENEYFDSYGANNLINKKEKKIIYGESLENVPSYVTTIGSNAFENYEANKIVIPSNITTIESYAFRYSTATEIVANNKTTSVGSNAFNTSLIKKIIYISGINTNITNYLSQLRNVEVVILDGSTSILSFELTSDYINKVVIPKTVSSISEYSFYTCEKLNIVEIDEENETYTDAGVNAIINKKTKTLIYGTSSTIIPNWVENIGNYAFYYRAPEVFNIPEGVKTIGYSFMGWRKVHEVYLPSTVSSISSEAFKYVKELEKIVVSKENENYYDYNNKILVKKNEEELVAAVNNVEIPSFIKKIGAYAYYYQSGHTDGNISEGVEEIKSYAYSSTGIKDLYIPSTVNKIDNYNPFRISGLQTITVSKNNSKYSDMDSNIIYDLSTDTIVCGSNNSIIPSSTKIIDAYSFYSVTMDSIVLPEGTKKINTSAFDGNIKTIEIPSTVNSISGSAFDTNTSLVSLTISKDNPYYTDLDSNGVFEQVDGGYKLVAGTVLTTIPEGVVELASSSYLWNNSSACRNKNLVLPDSLKKIEKYSIQYAGSITYKGVTYEKFSEFKEAFINAGGTINLTSISGMKS